MVILLTRQYTSGFLFKGGQCMLLMRILLHLPFQQLICVQILRLLKEVALVSVKSNNEVE